MTKREVASLALKLLGIYAFILSISLLHSMMYTIAMNSGQYADQPGQSPNSALLAIGSGIPWLLLIFLGWYLIAASERLGRCIFPQATAEEKTSALSSGDVQTIAFSIVGLLLLTKAAPGLFRVILWIWLIHSGNFPRAAAKDQIIQSSVVLVVQLVFGLYLFLGSKGLSGLWHKLQRTRGM